MIEMKIKAFVPIIGNMVQLVGCSLGFHKSLLLILQKLLEHQQIKALSSKEDEMKDKGRKERKLIDRSKKNNSKPELSLLPLSLP